MDAQAEMAMEDVDPGSVQAGSGGSGGGGGFGGGSSGGGGGGGGSDCGGGRDGGDHHPDVADGSASAGPPWSTPTTPLTLASLPPDVLTRIAAASFAMPDWPASQPRRRCVLPLVGVAGGRVNGNDRGSKGNPVTAAATAAAADAALGATTVINGAEAIHWIFPELTHRRSERNRLWRQSEDGWRLAAAAVAPDLPPPVDVCAWRAGAGWRAAGRVTRNAWLRAVGQVEFGAGLAVSTRGPPAWPALAALPRLPGVVALSADAGPVRSDPRPWRRAAGDGVGRRPGAPVAASRLSATRVAGNAANGRGAGGGGAHLARPPPVPRRAVSVFSTGPHGPVCRRPRRRAGPRRCGGVRHKELLGCTSRSSTN